MHTDALANVYARSLFELAHKAGGQDKISEIAAELEQITEVMAGDRRFREFIASPIIDRSRRSESLRRIFANRVTDLTLRFLLVLNGNGRLGHLRRIAAAFDHMVQEAFGRIEVDVFTAEPVDAGQLESISAKVRAA